MSSDAGQTSRMRVTWHKNGEAMGQSDYSKNTAGKALEVSDAILDKNNAYQVFFFTRLSRVEPRNCTR
ncbi:MAG: hypothetical protein ACREPB_01050 [Arenimonas sp.]